MNSLETNIDIMGKVFHYPVMYREVLELLGIEKKDMIVDCTVGIGSHALKFFEVMKKNARLIGIDKDEDSLRMAYERLKTFEGRFTLFKDDFSNLDVIMKNSDVKKIGAFFFDLGISTFQLNSPQRGFSFLREGPLDMRMDNNSFLSAYDLVNNLSEIELSDIFRKFGEERYARRIAHLLVEARRREPLSTTNQLVQIILRAVPSRTLRYKIHPATRTFQALRIAVNRELEVLKTGIEKAVSLLDKGGRIGVISFHSLEDRIVKHTLKNFSTQGILKIITKKPLTPTELEVEENASSRSAKLRIAEKK
jgi:16S rRNA (cytosine1402-N4)-methyltransferase